MPELSPEALTQLRAAGLTDDQIETVRQTGHFEGMVADVAAGHSADATRPAMVVAANPVVATESLRQQLRAHGVGEAEIDQLIVAGFGTAQTRDGRRVVMTRRGSERLVEFSRDRALPSQARATWILIATTAVIIAIVLAFVIH